MSLSTAGTELTETEFNRIPPSLALQIMDDMFSQDRREVALNRPRFVQAYHQWLKRDRDLKDKYWLDWHQKQKRRYHVREALYRHERLIAEGQSKLDLT